MAADFKKVAESERERLIADVLDMLSEKITPELVLNVMNENLGLIGYLVIDSSINGHSAGGVRMLPDVTLEELTHLARNMTLKYGFWRIPMGGAKTCVFVGPSTEEKTRKHVLSTFGTSLSALIKSGVYFPSLDMGASESDLQSLFKGAGRNPCVNSHGVPAYVYSSWTMSASAKAAASHVGLSLSGSKVAIEGFGNFFWVLQLRFFQRKERRSSQCPQQMEQYLIHQG